MSCPLCDVPTAKLAAAVLAEQSREGQACESCRARLKAIEVHLSAMRASAAPELAPAERERRVRLAVAAARGAMASSTPRRPNRLVWGLGVGALVAVVVIAIVVSQGGSTGPERLVLGDGAVAQVGGARLVLDGPVPRDVELETGPGSEGGLRLSDGTEVRISGGTRFVVPSGSTRFEVRKGMLSFAVKKRPVGQAMFVETDEVVVRVLGTRFSVSRSQGRSVVAVSEGLVEVTERRNGAMHQLASGTSIASGGASSTPDAGEAVDAGSEPTRTPARPVQRKPVAGLNAIRARLEAGQLAEAHALIRAAKQQSSSVDQAEVLIIEAEVFLAERQYEQALGAYLRVTREHAKAPQAEEALFAAAQLAIDHSTAARGHALLLEYQRRYPAGRFRQDVDRLLRK